MAIEIIKPNSRVGLADIQAFEVLFGEKLPEDYKSFLCKFNGGKPESNEFDISGMGRSGGVSNFFGLLESRRPGDLLYEQQPLRDRVPAKYLVIGNAAGGNSICVSLRQDTFGQVFFWDHELEADEGEPPSFDNLFKIGDSFVVFFEGLKKFNPSDVKLKHGQVVKKVWVNPKFLEEQRKKGNAR